MISRTLKKLLAMVSSALGLGVLPGCTPPTGLYGPPPCSAYDQDGRCTEPATNNVKDSGEEPMDLYGPPPCEVNENGNCAADEPVDEPIDVPMDLYGPPPCEANENGDCLDETVPMEEEPVPKLYGPPLSDI